MDAMPSPILITGCARSGTSMVAGAINLCGAFGGIMNSPNKSNEKSMFENIQITEELCKPYLRSIGADSAGQYPLPDPYNLSIPSNWRSRVEEIMVEQGYKGGPWMCKGSKLCLMWPVWHHAFPTAKWIVVRRRTADIIHSCQKTGYMKAFRYPTNQVAVNAKDETEGWLWWIHQHEKRFVEMITEGLNVKIVWPERMVYGDYQQMFETMDWLGLPWKTDVLSFIDPKLWRVRQGVNKAAPLSREEQNGQQS